MNKYHLTQNGYYAPCEASTKPCPLGSTHIGATQYQEMKNAGDPRVQYNFNVVEGSYLDIARKQFEEVNNRVAESDNNDQKVRDYTEDLYRKEGLKDEEGNFIYPLDAAKEKAKDSRNKALKRLAELYREKGVSEAKISFILEDVRSQSGIKPAIRKKDSRDPDIEEKTRAAVTKAKKDEEFNSAKQEYEEASEVTERYSKILTSKYEYQRNLSYETFKSALRGRPTDEEREAAQNRLGAAIRWRRAGVPDKAAQKPLTSVRPTDLSVDGSGKINNAWVEVNGGIERITSYIPPVKNEWGGSGKLITDKGSEVSAHTRYANYRSYSGGTSSLIVAPKEGSTFETERFVLESVIDSGD